MASKKTNKLQLSIKQLKDALKFYESDSVQDKRIKFLSVSKAFEIVVEYAWKEIKQKVEDEGLEAPSPKEAIRQAAKIGLITSPEKWIEFINARNSGVHDYFDISEEYYIELVRSFIKECVRVF